MTDEAPAFEQDQPVAPEAPETDQPTGGEESFTDSYNPADLPEEARGAYEDAYKRLQGDYTRKTQEISGIRQRAEAADQYEQVVRALQNPQTRAEALSQFGIDLVDEEPEEDLFADEPDLASEVANLKQIIAEQQEAQQRTQFEEQILDHVSGEIAQIEEEVGQQFSADTHKTLDALARSLYWDGEQPDVKKAYETLSSVGKEQAKAILEAKKNAPRRPGAGAPGSKAADLTNKEERERVMAEAANGAIASQ